MTAELIKKYEKLLAQFDIKDDFSREQRAGLLAFLSDPNLTEAELEARVKDFAVRAETPNDGYMTQPEDNWLLYIESFERRGTIRVDPSPASVKAFRAHRRAVSIESLKKTAPGTYNKYFRSR